MKEKSLKKNIIFNVLLSMSNILFPMITFPYLSRVLGPEYYGTVNFALSIVAYFILVTEFGIPLYGTREISKTQNDIKKSIIFYELFLISLSVGVISSIIYFNYISVDQKLIKYNILFLIMGFKIILRPFKVDWFFKGNEEFKKITVISLICKILNIILILIFIKSIENYLTYALILVIIDLINSLLIFILAIKKIEKIHLKKIRIIMHLKKMYIIAIMNFTTLIYLSVDTIMIGYLLSNEMVGYYTVAVKFNKIIIGIVSSINIVLLPRIIKKGVNASKFMLITTIKWTILIISPIIIGIILLTPNLILLVSGSEYLYAINTMRIMTSLILIITLSTIVLNQLIYPKSRERETLKIRWIGLGLNIILNYILIPKIGILGAAIASIATEFIILFQLVFLMKEELLKIVKLKEFYNIWLATTIMGLCLFYLKYIDLTVKNNLITTIILIILSMIIYATVLILKKEKLILNLATKFNNKI